MTDKTNQIAYIKQTVAQTGLTITDDMADKLLVFYERLVEKNKVMNLTAVTEFDEVVKKHFADSLTLFKVYDLKEGNTVLDLGTGAGFPGIPLAICYPEVTFTLLDSLNKRVLFLQDVIAELDLSNVTAVHERAEIKVKEKGFRETFDLVVSRAVANLSTLLEYCLPYVRVGGSFVSYKSVKLDEEMEAAKKALFLLGGEIEKKEIFSLFDMERSLLLIKKTKKTPGKYPRKAGLPAKEPLG